MVMCFFEIVGLNVTRDRLQETLERIQELSISIPVETQSRSDVPAAKFEVSALAVAESVTAVAVSKFAFKNDALGEEESSDQDSGYRGGQAFRVHAGCRNSGSWCVVPSSLRGISPPYF